MKKKQLRPWLRAFSGLSINLSAAWFTLAFITPNFANLKEFGSLVVLTRDMLLGIVFFVITAIIERSL